MKRRNGVSALLAAALLLTGTLSSSALAFDSPGNPTATGRDTITWTGQGTTNGSLDTIQCGGDTPDSGDLLWIFTSDHATLGQPDPVLTINGVSYEGTNFGGSWHFPTPSYSLDTTKTDASVAFNIAVLGNGTFNLTISHGCPGGNPQGNPLGITKTAHATFTTTYPWTIEKTAATDQVRTAGGAAGSVDWTVSVTKLAGIDDDWLVTGDITVTNTNTFDVSGVDITDAISDANSTCVVTAGTGLTVPATGGTVVRAYSCSYSAAPAILTETNLASVTWPTTGELLAGSADFAVDFTFAQTKVNDAIDVTDTNGNSWHFTGSDSVTYTGTVTGEAGTCTGNPNTATITQTGQSSSATVVDCQGADLTVSKTVTPAFKRTYNWNISKAVDKTRVEQIGGTATFNYTVTASETGFTDSDWVVAGKITVSNPNDWEAITADVTDAVPGGDCTVAGGSSVTIAKSSSVELAYSCTFAAQPDYNTDLKNIATATWVAAAASTPTGSASGNATFQFTDPTSTVHKTVTITDTFNGTTTTLGTLTATDATPFASATYTYSHTVNVPTWNCVRYSNTARIVETGQTAGQTVTVCGPAKTGALTMGFWQNKNGQAIITTGASTTGVCNSGTWLRQYAPFQNLSATATCAQVGSYVTTIIKAANASGSSMNAMLKAQMLATSLDVYFSAAALGGNKIGAPAAIGPVAIDLTKICHMIDGSGGTATCAGSYENVSPAFGGATSLTVSQMLAYAASQSNVGGSAWYGQVKATQGLAKDAFDAINNQVAFGV